MTAATSAPTTAVDATALAGSVASHDLSMFGLFAQADIVVKVVMLLLLLASVISWAIIFDKIRLFRSIRYRSDRFEKTFWSGRLLEELYERIRNRADHPMAMVFVAAMKEWTRRGADEFVPADSHLRAGIRDRIFQTMQVARNRAVDGMEKNLSFLATVGSSAPFVGLFGTVWGIMNSFQSIALSKNTTLAVVAPGIAEALFATAIGLFAAIPAMIFYNMFSSDVNRFTTRVDDFSTELDALISRELDGSSVQQAQPQRQQQRKVF